MDPLFFIMNKIPQADLKDFLSNDPKQKSYFVEHIGTAFRKIGFLALEGHFLEESLQKSLEQMADNFEEIDFWTHKYGNLASTALLVRPLLHPLCLLLPQSFIITVKGQKILVGKKAAHAQTLNFI